LSFEIVLGYLDADPGGVIKNYIIQLSCQSHPLGGHALINGCLTDGLTKLQVRDGNKLPRNAKFLTQICPTI